LYLLRKKFHCRETGCCVPTEEVGVLSGRVKEEFLELTVPEAADRFECCIIPVTTGTTAGL
jgi:hypothetical protein